MLRQPIVTVLGHVDHGKCVDPKTRVWLADGRLKTARELYEEYENQGTKVQIEDGVAIELNNGPELLSFDGSQIIKIKSTHVWKRTNEKLIKVKLSNGDELKVTSEHPFLIFQDSNLEYKRANGLTLNDLIAGPTEIQNVQDWKKNPAKYTKQILIANQNSNSTLTISLSKIKILEITEVVNEHGFVYDFTIPTHHNFLAERVIVHNTSLLDSIRKSNVQSREAGAITQHVGASEVPLDVVRARCGPLIEQMKVKFSIPGLLFIDTPGHEAFANLRKRGGSIADIAILVIDVNQGVQNQTKEAIEILKEYKTPFVVAATKIDAMSGWHANKNEPFRETIKKQRQDVQNNLDVKLYELVGQLSEYGFQSERFDRVENFTKQILIIPISARTGEGLPELLTFVAGLAQKFLEKRLELHEKTPGKGSILEVREEKGLGKTLDVILYDGVIREGDEITFLTLFGKAAASKVKALLKPKPLDEMRDPREKFKSVNLVAAASGVKIACENADIAVAGSEIYVTNKNSKKIIEDLESEFQEIAFDHGVTEGIVLKADTLGSLEAISKLFAHEKITIRRAAIGSISKQDVLEAASVRENDKFLGVVFSFNSPISQEVLIEAAKLNVKVFDEKIVYNLIEGYKRWVDEEKIRDKKEAFTNLTMPAKLFAMPGCCFRVSNPVVCGVEVQIGSLRKGNKLMNAQGEDLGEVQGIQHEKKAIGEAKRGQQIAVSIAGPTYGRQLKEKMTFYTSPTKDEITTLMLKYQSTLTVEELELLKEIRKIKYGW